MSKACYAGISDYYSFFEVDRIHSAGIKGVHAKVGIIEPNGVLNSELSVFKRHKDQIFMHPVLTSLITVPSSEKERRLLSALYGYVAHSFIVNDHAISVSALVKGDCEEFRYSGIAPQAMLNCYMISKRDLLEYGYYLYSHAYVGSGIYTPRNYFENLKLFARDHDFSYLTQLLHLEQKMSLEDLLCDYERLLSPYVNLDAPINDSLLQTMLKAIEHNHVVNMSLPLIMLQDPFYGLCEEGAFPTVEREGGLYDFKNSWRIPDPILNTIGDALEKRNSILVLAAMSDAKDITQSYNAQGWFSLYGYFKQFVDHPKISSRIVIAGNIEDVPMDSPSKIAVQNPSGDVFSVSLNSTSNYPGEDVALQNAFICAPGTNIKCAVKENQFTEQTGTSLSAPLISDVIGLMQDDSYQRTGAYRDAVDIVAEIRRTACSLGEPFKYGRGLINPRALFPEIFKELLTDKV